MSPGTGGQRATGDLVAPGPAILGVARAEASSPGPGTRDLTSLANKSEGQSQSGNRRTRRTLRTLLNRTTGELIEVDPRISRIRHMRRRVQAWARTCQMLNVQGRLAMIGLTYEDGGLWNPGDIAEYMNKLSHELAGRLQAYCWVAELQDRGAIHYHVLVVVDRGTNIPEPDSSGMWSHGSSNRGTAASCWYIVKYAQKGLDSENEYPGGARVFGASWRHLRQVAEQCGAAALSWARYIVRLSVLPRWVVIACNSSIEATMQVRRHLGGGWLLGNAVITSPWEVTWSHVAR